MTSNLVCTECHSICPRRSFSKNQLRKGVDGMKCKDCVNPVVKKLKEEIVRLNAEKIALPKHVELLVRAGLNQVCVRKETMTFDELEKFVAMCYPLHSETQISAMTVNLIQLNQFAEPVHFKEIIENYILAWRENPKAVEMELENLASSISKNVENGTFLLQTFGQERCAWKLKEKSLTTEIVDLQTSVNQLGGEVHRLNMENSMLFEQFQARQRALQNKYNKLEIKNRALKSVKDKLKKDAVELKNLRKLKTRWIDADLSDVPLNELQEMMSHISKLQVAVTKSICEACSKQGGGATQKEECAICMDREPCVALVPCGHAYCKECADEIQTCAFCRKKKTGTIPRFK